MTTEQKNCRRCGENYYPYPIDSGHCGDFCKKLDRTVKLEQKNIELEQKNIELEQKNKELDERLKKIEKIVGEPNNEKLEKKIQNLQQQITDICDLNRLIYKRGKITVQKLYFDD